MMFSNWFWFSLILLFNFIPIIGLLLEKKQKAILWYFYMYIFGFSWIPLTLLAFFRKNNNKWVHTKHSKDINYRDLKK